MRPKPKSNTLPMNAGSSSSLKLLTGFKARTMIAAGDTVEGPGSDLTVVDQDPEFADVNIGPSRKYVVALSNSMESSAAA